MSRDQLAVSAGTSSHSVAKLEQGMRAQSLELAWRLAKALGCTLDDLIQPASTSEPAHGPGRPPKALPSTPSADVLTAEAEVKHRGPAAKPWPDPAAPKKGRGRPKKEKDG